MVTKIRQDQLDDINVTTSAPTVNDDVSLGYAVGSKWFDTTPGTLYICTDATNGAAVWVDVVAALTATLAAVAFSGAYADLSGTPTLAAVATSGLYSDLTGEPLAGQLTTVGGSPTEVFTVTGANPGDFILTQLVNDGTNNVSILSADVTGVNQITVVFSADPGNDAIFNYAVFL